MCPPWANRRVQGCRAVVCLRSDGGLPSGSSLGEEQEEGRALRERSAGQRLVAVGEGLRGAAYIPGAQSHQCGPAAAECKTPPAV